uniref:Uncharacterized protein n=1 Tax=Oryza meridionalis TaxID=40149 RepID=A0A0E0E867_9ORYZ
MAMATALDMATDGDLMRMQLVLAKFVHLMPLLVWGWLELKKKMESDRPKIGMHVGRAGSTQGLTHADLDDLLQTVGRLDP